MGDLQLVRTVDLMQACEGSQAEDRTSVRISPRPMLKARVGQVQSPLVRAFASPQRDQERKEALPLPLRVLAAWDAKSAPPTAPPACGLRWDPSSWQHTPTCDLVTFNALKSAKSASLSMRCVAHAGLPKLQNCDSPGPAPFSALQAEMRNPPGCFDGFAA